MVCPRSTNPGTRSLPRPRRHSHRRRLPSIPRDLESAPTPSACHYPAILAQRPDHSVVIARVGSRRTSPGFSPLPADDYSPLAAPNWWPRRSSSSPSWRAHRADRRSTSIVEYDAGPGSSPPSERSSSPGPPPCRLQRISSGRHRHRLPGRRHRADFSYVEDHPIAGAYVLYNHAARPPHLGSRQRASTLLIPTRNSSRHPPGTVEESTTTAIPDSPPTPTASPVPNCLPRTAIHVRELFTQLLSQPADSPIRP